MEIVHVNFTFTNEEEDSLINLYKNPEYEIFYDKKFPLGFGKKLEVLNTLHTTEDPGIFRFKGNFSKGIEEYEVPDMFLIVCTNNKGKVSIMGASNRLIKTHFMAKNSKYDIKRYYISLKAEAKYFEIHEGLFIAIEDMPTKFIENVDRLTIKS